MSVESFIAEVNQQLATGHVEIESALRFVQDEALAQILTEAFAHAADPTHFETRRITQPDTVFDAAYDAISSVLDESILEPKDAIAASLTDSSEAPKNTFIMLARGWTTLGDCQYDKSGKLVTFDYAQDRPVFHVASALLGNYMSLSFGSPDRAGLGIGGLGQIATRVALQRGKGLGSSLHSDFERTCLDTATLAEETLIGMFLEAESEAVPFWRKMGYHSVTGSRYFQPPIAYDPISGAPLFDAVAENAMIKRLDEPLATSINAKLLCDIVRTVYTLWYRVDHLPVESQEHAGSFVESLYQDFVASIREHGDEVPIA